MQTFNHELNTYVILCKSKLRNLHNYLQTITIKDQKTITYSNDHKGLPLDSSLCKWHILFNNKEEIVT